MGQRNADHHDDEPLTEGRDYVLEGGRVVFTTDYLRRRGSCCGSGCRNCPWDRSRRQPRRRRKVVVAIGDEPWTGDVYLTQGGGLRRSFHTVDELLECLGELTSWGLDQAARPPAHP